MGRPVSATFTSGHVLGERGDDPGRVPDQEKVAHMRPGIARSRSTKCWAICLKNSDRGRVPTQDQVADDGLAVRVLAGQHLVAARVLPTGDP